MTRFDAPASRAEQRLAASLDRSAALRTPERFSLLCLSAFDRLVGAAVALSLLWAGVYWALR